MALPKNIRPEYSTTVPSSGKRIKYQPFSVKEEKILILAAESQDTDEITNAITKVVTRCITSPADFKVEELALFDVEYLFLKTRAKSAGEKIKINVTDPDDESFTAEHSINIDKITIHKDDNHKDLIELTEDLLVKMRYPDITFFNEGVDVGTLTAATDMISKCIKQIIIGEDVYDASEMQENELTDWLESLTTEQFKKITQFFETMPKLKHSFTIKNTNKDTEFTIKLEGLADFF